MIVIGNISVGGTGKTPVVSAVVRKLQQAGYRPGIVSRGYGAQTAKKPRAITNDTPVSMSGDEPALLVRETGVPVCICVDRFAAVNYLAEHSDVNVIVSDDGLQHYAMHRDIEVAVVDGQRLLGNGWLLPAGPLREPPDRLNSVDVIAVQQTPVTTESEKVTALHSLGLCHQSNVGKGSFHLKVTKLVQLHNDATVALSDFSGSCVHAIAGVGNPQRFFDSLRHAGIEVIEHAMADHHHYTRSDFMFDEKHPVIMTAKDAVKVRELDTSSAQLYELRVEAVFDDALDEAIALSLSALS